MRYLSLALALVACQAGNRAETTATVTDAQRAAIKDTIEKRTSDFLDVMRSLDADKSATFATRTPDYVFAGEDGSVCKIAATCEQQNKEGWKSLKSMEIRLLDSNIAVASPTVAVETIRVGGSIVPKAGKTLVIDKAAITIVWVREADGWKMLTYHQSFAPPKNQS